MDIAKNVNMLRAAEIQFRMACAVHLAISLEKYSFLEFPTSWTYGNHQVELKEIALTPEGAIFGASLLQQSATYLMAVQIQEAITDIAGGKARQADNRSIQDAFEIARLIRNGFTHHPFQPVWNIDPYCRNHVFEIDSIIRLDTCGLNGKPFDWRHYGGPLAVLRLSEFVRTKILGDIGKFGSTRDQESLSLPDAQIIQQGNIILRQLSHEKNH